MATRILLAGLCLLLTTQAQQDPTPAPSPAAADTSSTAAPTAGASRSSRLPAASSNTSPPTAETAAPTTFVSPSNTPSPSAPPTEVPSALPTPAPTKKEPTTAPTPSPTPPPTFSASSYCERPYQWSDEKVTPCAELASPLDRESGAGVFYDEEGCGPEANSTSVVGCAFQGVANCRVCVFYRELYSVTKLGGEDVPFVNCPCCVPELYGMGGDINCTFTTEAVPVPKPSSTPSPTEASVRTPVPMTPEAARSASNDASTTTLAPTVTPIPMEPCEIGAGGDTTGDSAVCVDVASKLDWANGIGAFYEEGCEGVGCNIAGNADCRQCVFDSTAYAESVGDGALVDCPCCVPITYKLRPQDSECVWPATPSPTPGPTTYQEFLEANGGAPRHSGRRVTAAAAAGAPLVMVMAAAMAVGVAKA